MLGRVLVTGAGGFLGRDLCEVLLDRGNEVIGVGRSAAPPLLERKGLRWLQGDLRDFRFAMEATKNIDAVVHLAGLSSPAVAYADPMEDFRNGPSLTFNLLESSRLSGVTRFLFSSSGGTIYGDAKQVPTPEGSEITPSGVYGTGKRVSEIYLESFEREFGLKTFSLRIANPFGPGQSAKRGQGIVAYALSAALEGFPVKIFGDGNAVRDFIFVRDVSEAFVSCLHYCGPLRLFNVGSGQATTINKLIDELNSAIFPRKLDKVYESSRTVDLPVSVLNIDRISAEMGWYPRTSLRDGLELTLRDFNKTNS